MPIMNFAQMIAAGVGPNGIMLNSGGVDGPGGGLNPLLTAGGQSTPGGGTYVPFGSGGSPASRLAGVIPPTVTMKMDPQQQSSPVGGQPYTFQTMSANGTPKTVTMREDWSRPIQSYGGTPAAGRSSGGLSGQQQQVSYIKKLADIVKAPKRNGVGEMNQSDIPQQ